MDKSTGHGNDTVHVSILNTNTKNRSAIITTTAVNSNLFHQVIVDQAYYDLEMLRQKYIGKAGSSINAIVPASDGGYLCVGRTNFNSSPGAADQGDAWIVQLTTLGDTTWTRTINRSNSDQANAVIATTDGGYIVAGETNNSNNSFVTQKDWWLIKLKSNGDTAWTKVMGTDKHEFVNGMAATPDGGFVIIGLYDDSINNVQDMLMAKFTSDGNVIWQKKLGGAGADNGLAVSVDSKGYIFVAGVTSSNNSGDVGSNHGENDSWVIKLNSNGDIVWSKVLGGNKTDGAYAISGTKDG
ncbi:MAG TPA: SBBP repeat-containing protein, partial [Niastella sp.]